MRWSLTRTQRGIFLSSVNGGKGKEPYSLSLSLSLSLFLSRWQFEKLTRSHSWPGSKCSKEKKERSCQNAADKMEREYTGLAWSSFVLFFLWLCALLFRCLDVFSTKNERPPMTVFRLSKLFVSHVMISFVKTVDTNRHPFLCWSLFFPPFFLPSRCCLRYPLILPQSR